MRAGAVLLLCSTAVHGGLFGASEKKKKRRKTPDPRRYDGEMKREWCTKERKSTELCRSRDVERLVETRAFWLMHENYCGDEERADRPPCIRLERSPKSPRSGHTRHRERLDRWSYGPVAPDLPHHPTDEGWDRDNDNLDRRPHSGPVLAEPTRAHPHVRPHPGPARAHPSVGQDL